MLCALSFLPTNDVINGFATLCQETQNSFYTDADDLLEYFENTYRVFQKTMPPKRLGPISQNKKATQTSKAYISRK